MGPFYSWTKLPTPNLGLKTLPMGSGTPAWPSICPGCRLVTSQYFTIHAAFPLSHLFASGTTTIFLCFSHPSNPQLDPDLNSMHGAMQWSRTLKAQQQLADDRIWFHSIDKTYKTLVKLVLWMIYMEILSKWSISKKLILTDLADLINF